MGQQVRLGDELKGSYVGGTCGLDRDDSTGCNIRTAAEENCYFIGDILLGAKEKYDFYNVKLPH